MKKRWLILIAVIVILVGWAVISRSCFKTKFNRRVEALAAEGYPVSLDDLEAQYKLPEGVENAADTYILAFEAYQDPNEFEREFLPVRGNYCWTDDVPPFPQEVTDAMKSSLKANAKTLELLDKAAEVEHCSWPRTRNAPFLSNNHLSEIKKAAMLLCERNLYLSQKGETDKLLKCLRATVALSQSISRQPFLIDYLVGVSLESLTAQNLEAILNQIEFTEAGLTELQKEFSDMQNSDSFYDAMVNERCGSIVFWKLPKEKQVQIMEAGFWQQQPKLVRLMASTLGFRQKDALLTLDYYEDYVNASQLPLYEQGQAFLRIEDKINNLPFFHIYLHEFPIFTKVGKIHSRVMGYLKCAETALAIERYRLKYQSLPESLGVLVPEFMDTAPIDPFDGRTLRYIQPDTGGYTLYTVGEDGVDNGGVSKKQVREKTGESNPKEYDWPFTVRR